ncbi:chaperonin 10-like protein [Suillus fuscotomentosus]|uniref:Chaperonin 10-like protein n=1 Tax=Suillus fuscotomentosus TaxID=1912939 RepID=A0AAD4HHU4_9AGAM|nr:chaperonin 10-like protein [Suillus fuscotomentosus]KAG1898200.1 chaperonin 10-like protein [Suillus fuscotomentosus]
MTSVTSQRAVRWHPPSYDIRIETLPIPKIEHPDDAIVKIQLAGLCGSDLHMYRGTARLTEPCIMGHEFIGEIVALGASFHPSSTGRPRLYSTLHIGDKIVSPFTVSCGECHFCRVGFTCRCVESRLFGTPLTPGGQAQYVRVPRAGGTLYSLQDIPDGSSLADSSLLLLCDILPTGVFAAFQALSHAKTLPFTTRQPYPLSARLGPVGVCACIALLDMLVTRKLKFNVIAIDPNEARRAKMASIYSTIGGNYQFGEFQVVDTNNVKELVANLTKGFGCNAVLEVVGNTSALRLAYELVRPFGCINSVGVHSDHTVPYKGVELYDKNVSLDFGRCPVRAMFPMALELLLKRQDVLGSVGGETSLVEKIASLDDAVQIYDDFDKGKCGKVLFAPFK